VFVSLYWPKQGYCEHCGKAYSPLHYAPGEVTHNVRAILAGEPIEEHLTNDSKAKNFYKSILLQDSRTCERLTFRTVDKNKERPS
jgi:hypothetical protein